MKKNIKIIAGVFVAVVCCVAFNFSKTPNDNTITEWDKLNNSLTATVWAYDEDNAEDSIEVKDIELTTEDVITHKTFTLPSTSGFKSFMPYNGFGKSSKQYALQQYAYTDSNGFRRIEDRYIIALGTYYFSNLDTCIGTYVDLVLENGTVISCVLGDIKADEHTDSSNIVTIHNGCVSEFIVNYNCLDSTVATMGDASYLTSEWQSPVAKVIVYEMNVFDTEEY